MRHAPTVDLTTTPIRASGASAEARGAFVHLATPTHASRVHITALTADQALALAAELVGAANVTSTRHPGGAS